MRNIIIIVLVLISFRLYSQDVSLVVQSGHSAPITDIKITADNKFIITSGEDKRIIVWDRKTQKQFGVLEGHTDIVTGLAVNKFDPEHIYSVSQDHTFRKWNIISGECVKIMDLKSPLGAIDFSPTTKMFVIGGTSIYLIDNQLKDIKLIEKYIGRLMYVPALIEYIAFDNLGKQIAFSDGKGEVGSLDLEAEGNGVLISKAPGSAVKYSDDGKYILLSHYKGGFSRYHISSISVRRSPVLFSFNRIKDFEALDKYYAIGDEKGRIVLLSKRNLFPKKRIKAHKAEIIAMDVSQDQSLLVTATVTGEIKLWDTRKFSLLEIYQGKVKRINDIDFSDDGKTIFVGFDNGLVRSFNIPDFSSASFDSRTTVNVFNDRRDLKLRNIHADKDTLQISLFKTKNSTEYVWLYDYIKDIDIKWFMDKNQSKVTRSKETSKMINDYYENIMQYLSLGSPSLLDAENLSYIDTSLNTKTDVIDNRLIISIDEKHIEIETKHSDKVTCVAYNPVGNFAATGSWDGLVKIWNVETGKLIMSLVLTGANQFVMVNPKGYYFSSRNAFEDVNFKYKNEIYSFDQFDLIFNRPDIVLAGISQLLDSNTIRNYHLAYQKRLSKLGVKEENLQLTDKAPNLTVNYNKLENQHFIFLMVDAKDSSDKLQRLHINVNGVPEFTTVGKKLTGTKFRDSIKINLNPGKNVIQTYVTSTTGTGSLKREIVVNNINHKLNRNLYIITLGASEYLQSDYNLTYASKDAIDINKYFSQSKIYDTIISIQLINNQITKDNVELLKGKLAGVKENDVVIFFAAGHGILSKDLDFYFASYDMDFSHPETRGIPYTLFDEILDNCKSRYKCMLLDACFSGEIDKEEVVFSNQTMLSEGTIKFRSVGQSLEKKELGSFDLSKALFADMRPNNGTTVISSAGGAEYALEGDIWKNGVFTYAFLNGLISGDADFNHDKSIQLSEIHRYVAEKVVELTKGKQTPTSRVENVYNDFKIK